MFTFAFVALLAFAVPASAAVDVDDQPVSPRTSPRVRPYDGRSAALLLSGIERSETIRLLVDRLEKLNVIAYIGMQPGPKRQLAGRMVWLSAAANYRYVRVFLNPELSGDILVSVLGHELQHVLEVAQAPSVVDEASLEEHYRKNGIAMRSHISGWDTLAARDTGDLVRRELASTPALRVTESVSAFDPAGWHVLYRRARDRFSGR